MFEFGKVFLPASRENKSSFEGLTEEQLDAHLATRRYGTFELTNAVSPSYDLQVIPREGYRHDRYQDEETKANIPVLMVAASREKLWDLFIDLLEPLGEEVDVVLETSHAHKERENCRHRDLHREHIDAPILQSIIEDYRDLLLNDGCTGIAVLNPRVPLEVQFEEHKLILIYAEQLAAFETILRDHDVFLDENIKFIVDAEHVHSSNDEFTKQFDSLALYLGMDHDDVLDA